MNSRYQKLLGYKPASKPAYRSYRSQDNDFVSESVYFPFLNSQNRIFFINRNPYEKVTLMNTEDEMMRERSHKINEDNE